MSEVTFIKGKDASLEDSIANMHANLDKVGLQIEEASWLNPVRNVYSLHITETSCPGLFTNGKGVSKKATLASAIGEFFERLSTNYFFSDYWLEPAVNNKKFIYYPDEKAFDESNYREALSSELWSFYDPENEIEFNELLSFNDCQEQMVAIPLQKESSGETVYFPMNLLSNVYASNGLSAGNTALEAQVQGLSEIFERWVKNRILRENLCLPEVPDSVIQKFPTVVEALQSLKDAGITVTIRDASLGGDFPVINVTLFEQNSGRCFASFGAHPLFEVALERTLTESLQGRHLRDLDGFQTPVLDAEAVAADENIENHFIDSSGLIHARFISHDYDFDVVEWDFNGTTEQQWKHLVSLVLQQNCEVYLANYQHCGFETCRIIVPGMSEIYPPTELLESNQNEGRLLREKLFEVAESKDFLSIIDLIDELGFSDHQGVASLIGLMPDSASFWAEVKICDLKFWCWLGYQDYEMALDTLHEAEFYLSTNSQFRTLYAGFKLCLEMMLESVVDEQITELLFGSETSQVLWANVNGEKWLNGAPLGKELFSSSERHNAMLNIYSRLHETKERFWNAK